MSFRLALSLAALLTLPAAGFAATAGAEATSETGTSAAYRDDRSTPEAVIASLYNAVSRGEYLRAWSYFREGSDRPSFESFASGYADTASIRLRLGETRGEGAAGSIYYALPVAIEATGKNGSVTVYTGCYELRLVQPAAQMNPPFHPLGIVKGNLARTTRPFADAMGLCPAEGLK